MLHTKEPKNLVIYISEKLLNSSASSYAYSQVRDSIYKIKSNLSLILSLRNKYSITQRLNKHLKLLLKINETIDKEMLVLEIAFLKDHKFCSQESLYPDNIPWQKHQYIGLYPLHFIIVKKFRDC